MTDSFSLCFHSIAEFSQTKFFEKLEAGEVFVIDGDHLRQARQEVAEQFRNPDPE